MDSIETVYRIETITTTKINVTRSVAIWIFNKILNAGALKKFDLILFYLSGGEGGDFFRCGDWEDRITNLDPAEGDHHFGICEIK